MSANVLPRLTSVLPRVGRYVLASLILHALVLALLHRGLAFAPAKGEPDEATIAAALLAPPPNVPAAATPAAAPPRVRARPARAPRPASPPPVPAEASGAPDTIAAELPAAELPAAESPPPADAPAPVEAPAPETPPAADAAPEIPAAAQTPTILHWPPAGTLHFKVEAMQRGTQYHGTSELRWQIGDGRYRIEQTTGVDLLITTLRLQSASSEGAVERSGLAPERYTEQRRNRAVVATNFNRQPERRSITFSSSPNEAPLVDGAQDRASVIFQLAGLLASQTDAVDVNRYEVVLAGTREAQTWVFVAAGEETVKTGAGEFRARRYVREPRAESYESRIELWYADEASGYPVQIRYTERNGDVIELKLDRYDTEAPGPG